MVENSTSWTTIGPTEALHKSIQWIVQPCKCTIMSVIENHLFNLVKKPLGEYSFFFFPTLKHGTCCFKKGIG